MILSKFMTAKRCDMIAAPDTRPRAKMWRRETTSKWKEETTSTSLWTDDGGRWFDGVHTIKRNNLRVEGRNDVHVALNRRRRQEKGTMAFTP